MTLSYSNITNLSEIFLEDSYVLDITESGSSLTFKIEAVLTESSKKYHDPLPGEQYCYANGSLTFANIIDISWIARSFQVFTDAAGEEDLGNIDTLTLFDKTYDISGDWGHVRVVATTPPQFVYAED